MSNTKPIKPVRNLSEAIDVLIRVTALSFVSCSGNSVTVKIRMLAMAGLNLKEISDVIDMPQKYVKKLLPKS